jgi:hypothetical protein
MSTMTRQNPAFLLCQIIVWDGNGRRLSGQISCGLIYRISKPEQWSKGPRAASGGAALAEFFKQFHPRAI